MRFSTSLFFYRAGDPIEISSDEDEPGPENDHNSGDDTSDTSIEQDLEEDESDSDESVEGLEDAYYGGYGNCFSCGKNHLIVSRTTLPSCSISKQLEIRAA